jgi:hypothetical protein
MRRLMLLLTVVLVMTAMLVVSAAPAFAVLLAREPKFDPTATISSHGRLVFVGGPIACTEGEAVSVWAIVIQEEAVAQGTWQGLCTGSIQRWNAVATTAGAATFEKGAAKASATFEEGAATACGVALTRSGELLTDGDVWCAEVALVKG